MRLAALALLLATAAHAQVEPLEAVFRRPAAAIGWRTVRDAEAHVGAPRSFLIGRGNAVRLSAVYALTSAHLVARPELVLDRLTVGGRPASVQVLTDALAIVKTAPADGPAIPHFVRDVPADGARLTQRACDPAGGAPVVRPVTWRRWSHVEEGFQPGMSGSGIFAADGALVGIAEKTDGLVLGPQDLADLARRLGSLPR